MRYLGLGQFAFLGYFAAFLFCVVLYGLPPQQFDDVLSYWGSMAVMHLTIWFAISSICLKINEKLFEASSFFVWLFWLTPIIFRVVRFFLL